MLVDEGTFCTVIPSCLQTQFGADFLPALFHQPFGCRCRSADADGLCVLQQGRVNFLRLIDEACVRVHLLAFVVQDFTVRALASAYEEHQVVASRKLADVRHAVGYLSADGVVILEGGIRRDVCLDVFHDLAELVERLGGLRIQTDVAAEVQSAHLLDAFYHDGLSVGLTHQSQHLGMSVLSVYHDLSAMLRVVVVLLLDALLQAEHHRTSGIDDFDVVLACQFVGGRWFAMGAEQHLHVVQLGKLLVVDGDEAHLLQTFAFLTVVYDVA